MASGKTAASWLAGEMGNRWAQVLEGMTGEKPAVESSIESSPSSAPAAQNIEWWQQPLSFPDGAIVYVGVTGPDASLLGGNVLQAAGINATPDDARGTYFETLSQALSGLGQSLTVRLRKEVTCTGGGACASPDAEASGYITIRITLPGQPAVELLSAFHPKLIGALQTEEKPAAQAASASVGAGVGAMQSVVKTAAVAPQEGPARTLELLYDVELPVSVSFGRAQLPLKDVIKLTSGSIVELNRSVTEPVEVIVNNCVIARGEVVVIEGNYGVRIDEIISRQDRLRTLK